jgi:xylulokinase
MALLGIDIGTGGSRALIVDDAGHVVAAASAEHAAFRSLQTGWAEQDPPDWWRACQEAIRRVLTESGIQADAIRAIGLSGQMHGAVLLDSAGAALRPAIIWCDQRTGEQCRWLETTVGADRLIELTANPALTNFTLTRLLWVRANEPDVWARVRHVLLPKDYVRFRMSGEYATDVADASGTLMLDVARRRWSHDMLAQADIDARLLPTVFESPEICARLSREAAAATGIREGTPIVAGAGDQAAGAIGMGITRPGAVSVTIGTSGVVFAATDRPAIDPKGRLHTFCHAIPDRWHVMGVTQAAGLSLRWLRDLLTHPTAPTHLTSPTPPTPVAYDELSAEALSVAPGADGVLWAPYLMGERTPHCDPDVRGALIGLAASHGRGHIIRAVMEGVAFSLRDTFSIFSELAVPVERVVLGGGGARSALWRQIQADVYGYAAQTVAVEEGAAYGAALLAGVGAGIWTTVDRACEAVVRAADTVALQPLAVSVMNERYEEYRRVYPALGQIAGRGEPVDVSGSVRLPPSLKVMADRRRLGEGG